MSEIGVALQIRSNSSEIKYSSSFSQNFSVVTAADGKAPIATVEEEDDDVPGE